MEQLSFYELAIKIIEEEKRPLSAEEIWNVAVKNGYDQRIKSRGKTPWASIGALIYVDIRDNKKTPFIKATTRPTKFYLKSLQSGKGINEFSSEELETEIIDTKISYNEKDLHAFLTYFASSYLKVFTKTINHSTSTKKEFGEWVHPDLVGWFFPIENWDNEVFELSSKIGNSSIKLYSFELKKYLTFSNLREAFFQAVSNSSWANEGYLVAAEISKDEDFQQELKRLSTAFGIGIIKIDLEDPDATEIIYSAKGRETLDWETINKLTMNSDFQEFVKRLKNDIVSKEIRREKYDKILSREQLLQTINRQ
jgi:hypothetical protein